MSTLSNALNDTLRDCGAGDVAGNVAILEVHGNQAVLAQQVALLVADIMERHDHQFSGQIYRDGLSQVLEAPEFHENANMRKIVQVFEQRSLLEQIADDYLTDGDLHVVIAGDGRYDELQDISMVIGSYGASNRATGFLGVIGPLRMAYGRNISVVRFVAGLMSEMVKEIYGYSDHEL